MIPTMNPTSQIQTLMLETALLAAEAQAVVALRTFQLARGGPVADAEYYRLYWEKWLAAWSQHARRLRALAEGRSEAAAALKQVGSHRGKVAATGAGSSGE